MLEKNNIVDFVAKIENLEVPVDVKAKVVINERTGTAVIGKDVKFQQLALFKRENADQVYTSLFDEKVADLFLSEQK